jgi:hypothetical protein
MPLPEEAHMKEICKVQLNELRNDVLVVSLCQRSGEECLDFQVVDGEGRLTDRCFYVPTRLYKQYRSKFTKQAMQLLDLLVSLEKAEEHLQEAGILKASQIWPVELMTADEKLKEGLLHG